MTNKYTRQFLDQIGVTEDVFSVAVNDVSTGGGGGGGVSYASQLPMSATDTTKTETAINNNKSQIDGLDVTVGLLTDDVANLVTDLDTNYTDTAGINTLLSDYETTAHATSTYATISNLDDTNSDVGLLGSRVAVLEAPKGLLKVSNTVASAVLTTTPTLASFPTTVLTEGTSITKTSNTLFTINKIMKVDLLGRLRALQTGTGTDTIANFDILKNGVVIQTLNMPVSDVAINTAIFVELSLLVTVGDTLSFNAYYTGSGGVTLSTTAPNPAFVLTIREV